MNHWHYDSLAALRAAGQQPANNPKNDAHRARVYYDSRNKFVGMPADVADQHGYFDQLLAHGWPDGMERASELSRQLTPGKPQSRKRRRRRGPVGDDIDMDRVRAGNLDRAWTRTERQARAIPAVVHIIVDVSVPAAAATDTLFWRGAAAWQACQQLEQSGYSVRVTLAAPAILFDSEKTRTIVTADVKQSNQRIQPTTLMAGVAHPAIFRLYVLAALHMSGKNALPSTLGRPDYEADLATITQNNCETRIVRDVKDCSTANNWLTGEKLGKT